jgi:hypothetical protein
MDTSRASLLAACLLHPFAVDDRQQLVRHLDLTETASMFERRENARLQIGLLG